MKWAWGTPLFVVVFFSGFIGGLLAVSFGLAFALYCAVESGVLVNQWKHCEDNPDDASVGDRSQTDS